jgi:DNA-directed RNA polymerase specialized sigma24 family protein
MTTSDYYEAEPTDAAAMVAHLADFDDPAELYARASAEQALLKAAAQHATGHKARALALLWRDGMSYAQIAELPWVAESRSGVQRLVERGRDRLED